jgi:uncharacterized protein
MLPVDRTSGPSLASSPFRMAERTPSILVKLGRLQAQRPWLLVLIAVLSILPTAWSASKLKLKTDFSELLPDTKDSVIESRRVSARLPGSSTLTVVAETKDANGPALEKFVDALVPKLKDMGPEWVGAIDYGVQDTRKFFDEHKLLFAKTEDLRSAHDEIIERYDYEVAKRSGTLIEDTEPPPPITAESVKKRLAGGDKEKKEDDGKPKADPYPNGYYEDQEHKFIALLVRSPVEGGKRTEEFKKKVAEVVAEVNPTSFDPSMEVRYTGGMITGAEEYNAVIRDLGEVGLGGVIGVLASVLLFFLRIRTVMTMGATLIIALAWTFGLTRYTIGYLNSSTGFLVSIIAGNGINYGIMYMARYVEARRDELANVEEAIAIAHRDSWIPTLASSATAMLAYGSLIVTDFRGFKHFGIIGSYGMLICWLTTYIFMPAILAASEKVLPSFKPRAAGSKQTRQRGYYGVAFAKAALSFPRALTVVSVLLGVVSMFYSAKYFLHDPMEYDMANIRNERKDKTAAGILSQRVDRIVGRLGQDGMAIMVDRLDQVPMLETELLKRRDAAAPGLKPFDKVVTIHSLLPTEQEAKIPLIEEMRDRMQRAKKRGFLEEKDWNELEPEMPKGDIKPMGIPDLPEQVARPFTEKDGTRGRIVYIVPSEGQSVWDAKYLIRWADSFRYTKLPTGEVIKGSGRAVIFADMIQAVVEDAPKAIAVSALGSILVIIVAFRGHRHSLGVFVPWLLGITGLCAFLYLKAIKLNFLNFVALPITIGIGAEYAHNLMQRYRVEGDRRIYHVVVETGGAVVLCSMTTTIGYLALLLSINRGIVSFGLAAAAGEITCVLAAVLLLPAALAWRARLRRGRGETFEGDGPAPSTRRKRRGGPSADGAPPSSRRGADEPAPGSRRPLGGERPMPELPEVEVTRRNLQRWLAGRTLAAVTIASTKVLSSGTPAKVARALTGQRVVAVERRAKWLRIVLASGQLLYSHLGMTGRWVKRTAKADTERFERARLDVRGASVRYLDMRLFGKLRLMDEGAPFAPWDALGPDPLIEGLDAETLAPKLKKRRRAIKEVLLDQSLFAGVGNIQAAESLWRAKIHPERAASSLRAEEIEGLVKAIDASIADTLALTEAEEIVYVEEPGAENPFRVYDREGEPCPRCRTVLRRIVQGGRSTVFCPRCQQKKRR